MANNGVTQPGTTAVNLANLDKLITTMSVDLNATKQLLSSVQLPAGASPYTYPVLFSSLPGEVQTNLKQFIPPGYTPPATITGQELIDIEQGVLFSLQELKANPIVLPKAGVGTVQTVQPTPSVSATRSVTTPATITAPAAPTPALARNVTPATITAPAAPAPAVLRNSTPATIPVPALPVANLPTNTIPATTTAPSTNPPSSIFSNILTAATVVGGGAIVLNALNNRVQNPTPTPVTTTPATTTPVVLNTQQPNTNIDEFTGIDEQIQRQQTIAINEEALNLVNQPLQEPSLTEVDEFTGIDEQIQRQQQINDGTLEFAGIDEQIQRQQQIADLGEFAGVDEQVRLQQAIAINEEEQNLINEPLREPPATTDGDEFTGIDEQVERQRQLEDGSLEFAGIDEQIALNENALQEPPQLSDEEIDAYLQTAGQQDETIAEQKVPDEFDGIDAQVAANKEQADAEAAKAAGMSQGLSSTLRDTQGKATSQDVANFQAKPDWRVRLSLAPGATYLYKDKAAAGILAPLAATDGVIFPYTPAISVQYAASYDPTELTHSNYKFFTYRGSAVDSVTITCDFTAQDTFEANYLLAVIHFFRSVTKMFYGQDQNPKIGTPPPLCYLSGLGAFQFDAHPLAITSFNYTLPTDVDYIRAGSTPTPAGVSRAPANQPINSFSVSGDRLAASKGTPGGGTAPPQFTTPPGSRDVTYVPTKMSISIQAVPIVTRNDISNKFSLKEYGTGKLLRGTQRQGGGIW